MPAAAIMASLHKAQEHAPQVFAQAQGEAHAKTPAAGEGEGGRGEVAPAVVKLGILHGKEL